MENNNTTTVLKTCLYLDDVRTPLESPPGFSEWNVVRNYNEFVLWIQHNGIPDYISFDHDLCKEHMDDYFKYQYEGIAAINYEDFKEKTGLCCARWLIEYCIENNLSLPRLCGVHSHNPMGAANIQSILNSYKKHCGEEQNAFIMKPKFKV